MLDVEIDDLGVGCRSGESSERGAAPHPLIVISGGNTESDA
jgi:hypothetical protein